MGAPMARNTAAAGLDVRVWNRTRAKAEAVEGAAVAASPEEAVAGADLVVTMLADGDAVTAAMEDGGTLAALPDGAAGTATRAKLVLNHWVLTLTEGVAETVAFAETLDVDPQLWLDAIEGGPLDSAYAQMKGEAIMSRSLEPAFSLALALKDAGLVLEAAERHDHRAALAEVIEAQMAAAITAGHGDEDMAATYFASRP